MMHLYECCLENVFDFENLFFSLVMKGHHGNQSINTKQHNKRQHSCCSQSPNETTNLQIEPCESPNETLISKKNNNKEQEAKIRSDSCQKAAWFMMGVGFLFPYNSVVTAIDFFAAIYFPSIDFALGWLLLAPSLLILCTVLGNLDAAGRETAGKMV